MIGQIHLKRRQERSYNGAAVAALKSGLQKYARRAMRDRGLACLVEMDLFGLIERDGAEAAEYARRHGGADEARARRQAVRKAKALRTNLVNRLVVMASEE